MRTLYDYNVTDCYKHNTYFCVTKIKYIIDNVQAFFITTITVVKELRSKMFCQIRYKSLRHD